MDLLIIATIQKRLCKCEKKSTREVFPVCVFRIFSVGFWDDEEVTNSFITITHLAYAFSSPGLQPVMLFLFA